MIDKLKWLIDQSENNPKNKELLLKVAEMPENKQEDTLKFIELFLEAKRLDKKEKELEVGE
jgi:hypothetical protein